MALRTNCSSSSVFLLPRAPDSNSFDSTKSARLSVKEDEGSWRVIDSTKAARLSVKEDEGSWRISGIRCALGLASLILAIELVAAGETQALESPPQVVESRRRLKIARWSEKRKCAPWRANSLEIIVPENLPRPQSQRRNWKWKAVAFTDAENNNAPAIQVISSKTDSNSDYCFSL